MKIYLIVSLVGEQPKGLVIGYTAHGAFTDSSVAQQAAAVTGCKVVPIALYDNTEVPMPSYSVGQLVVGSYKAPYPNDNSVNFTLPDGTEAQLDHHTGRKFKVGDKVDIIITKQIGVLEKGPEFAYSYSCSLAHL